MSTKRIIDLIEDFEAACFEEASENGPDRDYRKWAKDRREKIKKRLIAAIERMANGWKVPLK
jgi:hypothetical protein